MIMIIIMIITIIMIHITISMALGLRAAGQRAQLDPSGGAGACIRQIYYY